MGQGPPGPPNQGQPPYQQQGQPPYQQQGQPPYQQQGQPQYQQGGPQGQNQQQYQQQGYPQQGGQMGGQQQQPGMDQQGQYPPNPGMQGGQLPPGTTPPTTVKSIPIDPNGVSVTQTRPPEETTTTTFFSNERPALSVTGESYKEKDECVNFKVSSLPTDCCDLPKLFVPENVTKKCHKECKTSITHCCYSQCKYRELNIYKNQTFNSASIGAYLEQSIKNKSETFLGPWRVAIGTSLRYCLWDQMSKETTRPPIPLTTDRTKYLMNNAIQNGQGHYVNPEYQNQPPQPAYTVPPPVTEPLYVRQIKNRYCGIPIYVFRVVACMRVVNFVNCPYFDRNSTSCMTKREEIMKCGRELNYTV